MAPTFIADSDDDSEGNTFSPPPAAQAEEAASFASTRSELASLATSSTDPVFFQGIYKEQQIAAAREQQLRDGGGCSGGLQLTAPAGTEQTDPVSLPSQYPEATQSAVGDTNRSRAPHAIKSAIMRERRVRQDITEAADPYAFPSSAEEDQSGGGRHTSCVSAAGSSVAYCRTAAAGIGEDEKMRPPSRKRQRFSSRGEDAVDSSLPPTAPPIYSSIPPTMPPGDIGENEGVDHVGPPSILTPTMPIGEDPSLIINPRGLTSSQKEQYVALELPVSSNPEWQREHAGVPQQLPPQSSARAQRQKTPSKRSTPSKLRTPKHRCGKSQPGVNAAGSAQLGTPEQTQEKQSATDLVDSDEEGCELSETQAGKESKSEDNVYEKQPSPLARAKKKRGRPKKAETQTQGIADTQLETAKERNPAKTARKRGRPKKSQSVVVEERGEVSGGNTEETVSKCTEEVEAETESDDTTEVRLGDAAVPRHVKIDNEKTPEAVSVAAKETPQKPARKGMATPQNGSAGKPLYRIGLSKRSRIAPLLKSLPK